MDYGITCTVADAPEASLNQMPTGETVINVSITREHVEQIKRSFGVRDSKGREIGGMITIRKVTIEPRTDGKSGYISKECGVFLEASPHALRDGEQFGALQRDHRFTSREALDAYVAKYFEQAEKRARKAAAKAGAA